MKAKIAKCDMVAAELISKYGSADNVPAHEVKKAMMKKLSKEPRYNINMKEMITTAAAMIGAACLFVTSLTIIALNIEAFVPFAVGVLALFSSFTISFTIGWLFNK